jgi:hypothetical protein
VLNDFVFERIHLFGVVLLKEAVQVYLAVSRSLIEDNYDLNIIFSSVIGKVNLWLFSGAKQKADSRGQQARLKVLLRMSATAAFGCISEIRVRTVEK